MRTATHLLVWLTALLLFAAAPFTSAQAQDQHGRRLALVVGNSAYESVAGLKNASTDAELVAQTLSDLGFEVTLLKDAHLSQMQKAVADIRKKGKGAEAVLFYYSGHGFQLGGNNFLVPTDAKLNDRNRINDETLQLNSLIDSLADPSRPTIILIDACRDNPLPQSVRGQDAANGLAQVSANVRNTYVLFSTGPGNVSHDGAGDNGPFATALVNNLPLPDKDFVAVMKQVRLDVDKQTGGLQLPWEQSSMVADFEFNIGLDPGVIVADVAEPATPEPIEVASVEPGDGGLVVEDIPEDLVRGTEVKVPTPDITPTVAVTPTIAEPPPQQTTVATTPTQPALPDKDSTTTDVAALEPKPTLAPLGEEPGPGQTTITANVPDVVTPPTEPEPDPVKLAELVQTELKRIGCLTGTVDGDWGNGSRKALQRYFDAKKVASTGTEPSLELKAKLTSEPSIVCVAPPAETVATTPKPPKQPTTTQQTTTTTPKPPKKPQTTVAEEPAAPKKPKITIGGGGSGSFR